MTRVGRWCVVVLGTVLLLTTPVAVRSLPAAESDVSAAALLERVRGAVDRPWSGTVETEGALQLPDADRFSTVGALFGERTRLRVWWLDDEHWRVDRLMVAGETDLVRDGDTTLEWDYERAEATVSRDPDIRLPRAGDLVPPALAAWLLRGAGPADAARLPSRRVAGTSAPGLRVRPASTLSSIEHVDVWTDPDSGVPLLVEVYADGAEAPALTTRFHTFSSARPAAETVTFEPGPRMDVEFDDVLDIADAANQYAPVRPPAVVAGLERTAASDRAVGVYGQGMTQLIAIPLRDREADALRTQLAVTPGVVQDRRGTLATLGPLGVLLTGSRGDGGWLLAGTLTRDALERAGTDVLSGFVYLDDDR